MPIGPKYLFGRHLRTLCPICYWVRYRTGHDGWAAGGVWQDLIAFQAPGCGHWECLGQYD